MSEKVDPSAPPGIEAAIRASSLPSRSFGERVVAALKLDATVYEEVENDPTALPQAFSLVFLSAVAAAIGYAGLFGLGSIVSGIASGLLTWVVWTGIVWLVGVRFLGHTSNPEELLRTLGFVAAPQLLFALLIIPVPLVRSLIGFTVLVMTVIAFVRATRAALDVETGRGLMIAGLCIVAHLLLSTAMTALGTLL